MLRQAQQHLLSGAGCVCVQRRGTSSCRLSLRGTWRPTPRAPAAPGLCCGDRGGQLLNGQSFLCATLGADALAAAARLLRTPHVFIYDAAVPDAARRARRAASTGAGACSVGFSGYDLGLRSASRNTAAGRAWAGEVMVWGLRAPFPGTAAGGLSATLPIRLRRALFWALQAPAVWAMGAWTAGLGRARALGPQQRAGGAAAARARRAGAGLVQQWAAAGST